MVLRYMVSVREGNFQLQSSTSWVCIGFIMNISIPNNYGICYKQTHFHQLHKRQRKQIHHILLFDSEGGTFCPFPQVSIGFIRIQFHRHFLQDFTNLPYTLFLPSASYFLTAYFTIFHCRFFFFYKYLFTFSFLSVQVIGPMNLVGVPQGATKNDKYSLGGKSLLNGISGILSRCDIGNLPSNDAQSGISGMTTRDLVYMAGLMGMGIEMGLHSVGLESLESVILIFPKLRELLELESSSCESFLFFLTEDS